MCCDRVYVCPYSGGRIDPCTVVATRCAGYVDVDVVVEDGRRCFVLFDQENMVGRAVPVYCV
jgi:hypothetical protein